MYKILRNYTYVSVHENSKDKMVRPSNQDSENYITIY